MTLLSELDPEGVAARKAKRLVRRLYFNKVCVIVSCLIKINVCCLEA